MIGVIFRFPITGKLVGSQSFDVFIALTWYAPASMKLDDVMLKMRGKACLTR